ncbi:MAG: hypothetical protein IJC31_05725 [Spirochaetaceae bacterium]|nr:hypothetical protein [Spirochaetaceae bacterium]
MRKILMIACWFFIFFLFSCGLDTFYYLDPPVSRNFIDEAQSPSQDPSEHYVSFVTASNGDNRDIFQGTAVYYKIYNSASRLLTDKAAVESINNDNSNQGMNRLIGWGYQALTTSAGDTVNLVGGGNSRQIVIRLFDESLNGDVYNYPAKVTVDDSSLGIPLRCFDKKTFSFKETVLSSSVYSVPKEGDMDVSFSTNVGTVTWYVALYAVSTGMSPSLAPIYSQVTYLGSLAITPTSN